MKKILSIIISAAIMLSFFGGVIPGLAEETGSGTVYYYSDMSGEGSLNGATTDLHVRTATSFKKDDGDGTDYMRFETIDGEVKTNYSYLNLPAITNTDDVKPDMVFELRLRNNMNSSSLITTKTTTHAFLLYGTNIRLSYYSPEYAVGNIGTYSYNTWNTITIVYRGTEDRREFYMNGVHLADSLPGNDNSGRPYNNWYKNGRLDLALWFYLAATGHYADIDYVKIYKLPESLDASVVDGDAADLKEIYIAFNVPVTLTKEMITLSSGAVEDATLWDNGNNIWKVTLSEPLEIKSNYEVSVSGAKDIFGNTLEKTMSFTTRDKAFDGGALSLKNADSEITSYTSGSLFLEGKITNELADEKTAAIASATYDTDGKMISPFVKALTVPGTEDLTDIFTDISEEVELPADGVKTTAMIWEDTEKPVPVGDIVSYGADKTVYDYKPTDSPFSGEAELNLEIVSSGGEKLKAELTLSGAEREFLTGILVKNPDGATEYIGGGKTENGALVFEIPLDYTKIGKYTVICGVDHGGTVSEKIDFYSPTFISEKTADWINSESATAETAADFIELLGEYLKMDISSYNSLQDKERVLEVFLGLKALYENSIFNSDEEMIKAFSTAIAMEKLYEGTDTQKILTEEGIFTLSEELLYLLSSVISPRGMEYISDELKGEELMLPSEVEEYVKELTVLGGIYKAENYMQVSGIITALGEELGIDVAGFNGLKSPSAVAKGVMNKSYATLEELSDAVNKLITERRRAEASTGSSGGSGGGGGGGGSAGKININTESPKKEENKEEIKEEVKEEVKRSFPDVKETDWFYEDVMWAASKGIFIGTDTGVFLPGMNLTFEHVSIIFKRMGYAVSETTEKRDITRAEFAEYLFRNLVKDGSFTDSKKWIESEGIFKGDGKGDMMYDKPFTRAECCTVLRRLENEEI